MAQQLVNHSKWGRSWRPKAAALGGALALLAGASLGLAGAASAAPPELTRDHGQDPEGPGDNAAGRVGSGGGDASASPNATPSATSGAGKRAGKTTPGDNGTVKVHEVGTAVPDHRNEPHVCRFYLDAFGFDRGQDVAWTISQHPPTGRKQASAGSLVLDDHGAGHTGVMGLPSGHYKLTWTFVGQHAGKQGAGKPGEGAKHKVFWVRCDPASETSALPGAATGAVDAAHQKSGTEKRPADPADPTRQAESGKPGTDVSAAATERSALARTGFPVLIFGAALGLLGAGTLVFLTTRRLTLIRRRH